MSGRFKFSGQFLPLEHMHRRQLVLQFLELLTVVDALAHTLPAEVEDFLRDAEVIIYLLRNVTQNHLLDFLAHCLNLLVFVHFVR